jgi:ATP-dependent DNA ligase
MDGELVAMDSQGVPTFEALQRALRRQPGQRPLYFQVFDLLELDGRRLTGIPLVERKPAGRRGGGAVPAVVERAEDSS